MNRPSPTREKFLAGFGEPEEITVREIGPRPELSFRSSLLHKLNLIIWAEGTQTAAARAIGVHYSTFKHWLNGTKYPIRMQAKLDARYLVAFEKHRLKHRRAKQFC